MFFVDSNMGLVASFPVFLLVALGVRSGLFVIQKVSRTKPGHCQNCDYNLHGNVTGVCPECGTPMVVDPDAERCEAKPRTRLNLALFMSFGVGILTWLTYAGLIDLGLPFGYYEQLNRVQSRLKAIPGVRIIGTRCNTDMTLEDFTFDLIVANELFVSLYFHEPPSLSWQMFDSVEGMVVYVENNQRFSESSTMPILWFAFGDNAPLGNEIGITIKNANDALTHLDEIVLFIHETPAEVLMNTWSHHGQPRFGQVLELKVGGGVLESKIGY